MVRETAPCPRLLLQLCAPSVLTSGGGCCFRCRDNQTQVKRCFDRLTELGLNVWMDTQGGMATDVYDSMAEGVSGASAVVCFMSQKYQASCHSSLSRVGGLQRSRYAPAHPSGVDFGLPCLLRYGAGLGACSALACESLKGPFVTMCRRAPTVCLKSNSRSSRGWRWCR